MELGDKVYYKELGDFKLAGVLVGVRETNWSDAGRDFVYSVLTPMGKLRNIYDNSVTSKIPYESIADVQKNSKG
jgi:hypothetical protein